MNGFWKRRLPALVLALLLVIGLAPSALAVDPLTCPHTNPKAAERITDSEHRFICKDCGDTLTLSHSKDNRTVLVPATCHSTGVVEYTCSVCNYSWQETLPLIEHNYSSTYTGNDISHWQTCLDCGATSTPVPHRPSATGTTTAATCTEAAKVSYQCADCGRQYTTTVGDPLGHTAPDSQGKCVRCRITVHSTHSFTGGWVTDSAYHWQVCSTCGVQGSRAAHADSNGDGRCDTCNYGMNAGVQYAVTFHTGSGTSIENVAKGGYPKNTPSVPSMTTAGAHVFQGWISGTTSYYAYRGQLFVSPGSIAVNSNVNYSAIYKLRATGQNAAFSAGTTGGKLIGTDVRSQVASKFASLTGYSSFSTIRFTSTGGSGNLYANSSKATLGTGNYTYSDLANYLYFVPSTAGSLTLNYTAVDTHDNQISGTLTISGTTVSNSNILYRVAPGGTVNFRTSDFEKAYNALSGVDGTSVRYVSFIPSSSYDSFAGSMYTGGREMTRDRLNQWSFYISNERYGGDYALDTVNFKADKNAKDGAELTIAFRAYYSNATYYDGTLSILIDKDGQEGDVVYRVAPGGSVTFNRVDFNNAYQDVSGSSRTIRYVEFDPGTDYTGFSGKISASGRSDFDRNTLSREQFNYTGSSYGSGYALDDLTFRATSSARDGDSLEIPFRAYYSRDDYADGSLRIIVDKYGSRDTVTLNVAPGGTTRLDKTAFNEVYRALSEYTNRTISAVSFYAPDSYKNFEGSLYVRNTAMTLTDLTHSKTWFYYSSSKEGDYALDDLTFQTTRSAREGDSISIPFRAYYNNSSSDYEEGTLRINVTSAANTITYEAAPGGSVDFKIEDFNKAYQTQSGSNRTIRYVAFEANSDYASFAGNICTSGTPLTRSNLTYTQTQFYYSATTYGTYALSSLSFRPDAAAKDQSTLSVPFRAYYDGSDYEEGTLKLVVSTSAGGDIAYVVTPGKTVNFDRTRFDDFYRKTYSGESLSYIVFSTPSAADFPDSCGTLYAGYNTSYSTSFSRNNLRDVRFYYNSADAGRGDYALNEMTFAAASSFTSGKVVLRFTAYGAGSRSVDGTLVITPAASANATSNLAASVRYAVTSGTNVQINANDLARFYRSVYSNGILQYVTLTDVPAAGTLYYNYYSASSYGTAAREQITASNRSRNFYLSPASTGEYALTELTYVPSGSNYCASIPFMAYGTNGQSVAGAILISVTNKAVSEVYGPTPRNTAVSFASPAASMYAAVSAATGTAPVGFQLLKLPAANVGTVYVGSDTSTPANTTTVYGYNTGAQQLSQLRFVPAANYTGPVDIPYAALNASGVPIASGVFSMGVLNSNKKFNDITASTWCYKYVTELADASVIDGYSDGNFKPDNTITYGAALKLIMLAAGYSEQAPTVPGSTFSGYLAKAQADGLITRSNVNLGGTITRLQVAQLAAGALKLDINNLSSVKPFTDTADVYVQALNAAGIVEGYFNNGTSTFRPSNTLTRGQVSAIVWRMQNYRR